MTENQILSKLFEIGYEFEIRNNKIFFNINGRELEDNGSCLVDWNIFGEKILQFEEIAMIEGDKLHLTFYMKDAGYKFKDGDKLSIGHNNDFDNSLVNTTSYLEDLIEE